MGKCEEFWKNPQMIALLETSQSQYEQLRGGETEDNKKKLQEGWKNNKVVLAVPKQKVEDFMNLSKQCSLEAKQTAATKHAQELGMGIGIPVATGVGIAIPFVFKLIPKFL